MTENLKTRPESTEVETSSHIPVNPLYTPADLKGSDYESWGLRPALSGSRRDATVRSER